MLNRALNNVFTINKNIENYYDKGYVKSVIFV